MSHSTRPRAKACHRKARRGRQFRARVAVFAVLAIAAFAAAGLLLWPRGTGVGPADQTVQVSMGGFSTPTIEAVAGQMTYLVGLGYLVLYNLVFVAPLVAMLAVAGSRPVFNRLGRWQLHHRAALKAGLGVTAIGLGLVLLVTL